MSTIIEEAGSTERDVAWMQLALDRARQAAERGEVPVGAVVVRNEVELGSGYNCPITSADPTAHAEIVAIRHACQAADNYRIPGATLYVTLEPCVMCLGAIVHARVSRIVYAAREPKAGALVSNSKLLSAHPFNWEVSVTGGVLENESAELISGFFRMRREQKKQAKKNQ